MRWLASWLVLAAGCGDSAREARDTAVATDTIMDTTSEVAPDTVADATVEDTTVADATVADTTVEDATPDVEPDAIEETTPEVEPETVACACVGDEICVAGECVCETLTLRASMPARNAIAASPQAPLALTFSCRVALPTTAGLTVVSSQRGRTSGAWSHGATENVVVFTPTRGFLAGERVDVTITEDAVTRGDLAVAPLAFGYTIATAPSSGSLQEHPTMLPNYKHTTALGDVDGDGDLDLVSAGSVSAPSQLQVWLGASDASGPTFTQTAHTSEAAFGYAIVLGDIDGDGDSDGFATRHVSLGPKALQRVLRNDGTGTFTLETEGMPQVDGTTAAMFDADRDGDLDVVLGSAIGLTLLVNDGTGHFTSGAPFASGVTYRLTFDDYDDDGALDLAYVGFASGASAHVAWGDGRGGFVVSEPLVISPRLDSLALGSGDADGDGDVDLVLPTMTIEDPPLLLRNDGLRSFTAAPSAFVGPRSLIVRPETMLFDADGDGDLDAYAPCSNSSPQDDELWVNDGAGTFTVRPEARSSFVVYEAYPGDLDGDGDVDLLEVSTSGARLLINQPGARSPAVMPR